VAGKPERPADTLAFATLDRAQEHRARGRIESALRAGEIYRDHNTLDSFLIWPFTAEHQAIVRRRQCAIAPIEQRGSFLSQSDQPPIETQHRSVIVALPLDVDRRAVAHRQPRLVRNAEAAVLARRPLHRRAALIAPDFVARRKERDV